MMINLKSLRKKVCNIGLALFTLGTISLVTLTSPVLPYNKAHNVVDTIAKVLDDSTVIVTVQYDSLLTGAKADSLAYSSMANYIKGLDYEIDDALYLAGEWAKLAYKVKEIGLYDKYWDNILRSDSFMMVANLIEDSQDRMTKTLGRFQFGLYGKVAHKVGFTTTSKTDSCAVQTHSILLGNNYKQVTHN